jgi:hypothetical protein
MRHHLPNFTLQRRGCLHDRAENECVVRDDLRLADGRGLHRLDAQRLSRLRRGAHQNCDVKLVRVSAVAVSVMSERVPPRTTPAPSARGCLWSAGSDWRFKLLVLNDLLGGRYRTRTYDLVRVKHAL